MKVIEKGIKDCTILPAAPGTCPVCATSHNPDYPHNLQSLYYQMSFMQVNDRWPTLVDSMQHCTDEIKQKWCQSLLSVPKAPEYMVKTSVRNSRHVSG